MSRRSVFKNSNTYILYAVGGVLTLAVVTLVVYFVFFKNSFPDENGPCTKNIISITNGVITQNSLCTPAQEEKYFNEILKAVGIPLSYDRTNPDPIHLQKLIEFGTNKVYYKSSLIGGKTYYFPNSGLVLNGKANLDDITAIMKGSETFPFSGLQTDLKSVLNDLPEEFTLSMRFTDNVGTFTLP